MHVCSHIWKSILNYKTLKAYFTYTHTAEHAFLFYLQYVWEEQKHHNSAFPEFSLLSLFPCDEWVIFHVHHNELFFLFLLVDIVVMAENKICRSKLILWPQLEMLSCCFSRVGTESEYQINDMWNIYRLTPLCVFVSKHAYNWTLSNLGKLHLLYFIWLMRIH